MKDGKSILRALVPVPYEEMGAGPWGYRVQVVDYDASSNTLMKPWQPLASGEDPFVGATRVSMPGEKADPRVSDSMVAWVMRHMKCNIEEAKVLASTPVARQFKAIGNSIATPALAWLGNRIHAIHQFRGR